MSQESTRKLSLPSNWPVHLVGAVLVFAVGFFAFAIDWKGQPLKWRAWTGFGEDAITSTSEGRKSGKEGPVQKFTTTNQTQSGKTLWDWLQLSGTLAVPVLLAILGYLLQQNEQEREAQQAQLERKREAQQAQLERERTEKQVELERERTEKQVELERERTEKQVELERERTEQQARLERDRAERQVELERERAEQQARLEREIAATNSREEALQIFLDRVSELLLDKKMFFLDPTSPMRDVALDVIHVRTLTVLRRLDKDGERKAIVLRFLYDAELSGVVDLRDADLSNTNLDRAELKGVNLKGANLRNASLRNANLSGAHLEGANLSHAKLRNANLSGAHLRGAKLINTNLVCADLSGADLVDAKGLKSEQVQAAANWKKACYSPKLCQQLGLPSETPEADEGKP